MVEVGVEEGGRELGGGNGRGGYWVIHVDAETAFSIYNF